MEIVGAIVFGLFCVGMILNPAVDHSQAEGEAKAKLVKWHIWGPPKD